MTPAAHQTQNRCQTPDGYRTLQDAFAASFAAAASAVLGADVHVRPAGLGLPGATDAGCRLALSGFAAVEEAGSAPARPVALVISPPACFGMVDRLLGGRGGSAPPARAVTDVERRLLARFAGIARASLSRALPEGARARLRPVATVEDDDEASVHLAFSVAIDTPAGRTPPAALWLSLPAEAIATESAAPPEHPREKLELTASLPPTRLRGSEVAGLATGDTLASGSPPDAEVIVRVAGIPKYVGQLGRHNGRRAVTVLRRIGEEHTGP